MQIRVDPRDAVLLASLADYLESTPDKVTHGIIEFFIQKGRVLMSLGDTISTYMPEGHKGA